MTDQQLDDQRLIAWLQRGSQGAPAELLADVLEHVGETRQRAGWRASSFWVGASSLQIGLAATAVVAIVAVALWTGRFEPGVGPGASASEAPSATASSTPPATSPTPQVDLPFTYELDPASGMTLDVFPNWMSGITVDVLPDIYQFRTRDPADTDYRPAGVNILAVPDIKTSDFCVPGGPFQAATPANFIDTMRLIPGLDVSATTHATIDGHDALVVTVIQDVTTDCPNQYLYPGMVPLNGALSNHAVRRIELLEVDGQTVEIATYADRGEADAATFLPVADRFIATIHFQVPGRSPGSSP